MVHLEWWPFTPARPINSGPAIAETFDLNVRNMEIDPHGKGTTFYNLRQIEVNQFITTLNRETLGRYFVRVRLESLCEK